MDVLGCVVNIDSARVILPTDTSFNVSCETLAMQQQNFSNKQQNYQTTITNGFLSTTTDKNLTENTSLHPNTTQNDYSSMLIR